MAKLFKGAPVAAAITEDLKIRVAKLKEKGVNPVLAIVRTGEAPGDISYETGAVKRCEKVGIEVKRFVLPRDAEKEEILKVIEKINADPLIHGCLMFRPLKDKAAEEAAGALLEPAKDMDAMTMGSLASVFSGRGDGYPPCTASACIEILDYYGIPLKGKKVAVIGRSLVIGRPVAMMLMTRDATVTICHTKSENIEEITRGADIIIAAAGHIGTVTKNHLSPGQVIIDVGINMGKDGKITGDVLFDEAEPMAFGISPVPGGVGAVTTAVLAKHCVEAAEKLLGARLSASYELATLKNKNALE